jgi:hypothetical protein
VVMRRRNEPASMSPRSAPRTKVAQNKNLTGQTIF